jgi:hypothetical protein
MKNKRAQTRVLVFLLLFGFLNLVIAGDYDEKIYQVQKKLAELGYNPGSINGVWGESTEKAVTQFQQNAGLPITAKLDKETSEKLGLKYSKNIETLHGHSAVCPYCFSTSYCIWSPGHGGAHACLNGHTWW